MKLVKTFENFMDFDPDFAIAKIKHSFPEYNVKEILSDEIENWIEDNQIDKHDWYYNNASGEAEEIVIDQLINWYEIEFKKELTEEQRDQLSQRIIKDYPVINPNNY